jgi:hypothetical protein
MRVRRLLVLFGWERPCQLLLALTVALLAVAVNTPVALAGPWWRLESRGAPTNLKPGGRGLVLLGADDLGDAGIDGHTSQVTITDTLPEGLTVASSSEVRPRRSSRRPGETAEEEQATWSCSLSGRTVTCSTTMAIPAYERLNVTIPVHVNEPTGTVATLQNRVSISGGETEGTTTPAPGASLQRPLHVNPAPTVFGVEEDGYQLTPEEEGGTLDTTAGSHPFQLTSTLALNQTVETFSEEGKEELRPSAPALARNLQFMLPPGLLGDVSATEQCSETDFKALEPGDTNRCPAGSAVGVVAATVTEPTIVNHLTLVVPLFSLKPAPGEPARFGFEAEQVPVVLDTSLRSGGDYGVDVSVTNTTQAAQVLGAEVTFWGVPGDPRHDNSRGWACLLDGDYKKSETELCEPPSPRNEKAFLTLPTSCAGQLASQMTGESWPLRSPEEPPPGQIFTLNGEFVFQNALEQPLERLEHCPALLFEPRISAQPREAEEGNPVPTHQASTPTGLQVKVTLPQASTLDPQTPGEADLKETIVKLPAGLQLNPSAANGLQACSEQQIGYQGEQAEPDPLAPGAAQPLRFSDQQASCPQASELGIVRVKTPLLTEELTGYLYLAEPAPNGEPGKNPFDSLLALYMLVEAPALGIRVKLAGETVLEPVTGQISSSFKDTPQVPFEELELRLFGGPRGSLATPPRCGTYSTQASFTPWSGQPAVQAVSDPETAEGEFAITTGPGETPCSSGALPFGLSSTAGSASNQAGAFTSFTLQLARPDGDQALTGLSVSLPPGIAGLLAKLTPCPEPPVGQEWACGPESLIGYARESSGVGPEPYALTGQVYLTSGYDGAPFGLLVRTLAQAGPFNLGYVNVRSQINVDPHTAQVTITSAPGPRGEAIPTTLKGIPVDLKTVEVVVDRPEFQFNPTNCAPKAVSGTLYGSEGATQDVSSPFRVTGCQDLPFKPGVVAATQSKTSKADGASLELTFKSKSGEAHVAKTILTIPAALPARLTTIQKACIASVFEANPAACPEGSDIGTAVVHTPVLKNPVSGPIYLVSHGNAAWPDAELVLQGEGITVILDGQTAIKKGVTTSSFLSVPDVPFETVRATLPEGPHSALTMNPTLGEKAHYNLCGQHLSIPTQLTGQNGTLVNETVKVEVQGCAAVKASKTRKLTRAQQLALALKACRKGHEHSRATRAGCERHARRRYGARQAARARYAARKTARTGLRRPV